MTDRHLFIFGPGYTAGYIGRRAVREGWQVSASYRDTSRADALRDAGFRPVALDRQALESALPDVTHILSSVAPGPQGDPVLPFLEGCSRQLSALRWLGYLSSTNVYGDHGGDWVDEETPASPNLERGIRRVAAEQAWQAFADANDAPLHIFRLAGIYGPGRNAVRTMLDGRGRRIFKEGQLFSRIHVADIEETVWRAMGSSLPSRIFNLADDAPAAPQDIIEKAAIRLGLPVPPLVPIEQADLSPMARSFYEESKRVRNARVKEELGLAFRYPDFDSALEDLVAFETKQAKA